MSGCSAPGGGGCFSGGLWGIQAWGGWDAGSPGNSLDPVDASHWGPGGQISGASQGRRPWLLSSVPCPLPSGLGLWLWEPGPPFILSGLPL